MFLWIITFQCHAASALGILVDSRKDGGINLSPLKVGLAILLAVLSFIRKVVYGRRAFFIEQYDIIIGVMLLVILISGIFIKGDDSFFG